MSQGDRDNFSGDLELVAPTGGVVRGRIYSQGALRVVARSTAAAGAKYLAAVSGPVKVEKATGTGKAFTVGERVYALANVGNKTATGAVLIGYALKAAATADSSVLVDLKPLANTIS